MHKKFLNMDECTFKVILTYYKNQQDRTHYSLDKIHPNLISIVEYKQTILAMLKRSAFQKLLHFTTLISYEIIYNVLIYKQAFIFSYKTRKYFENNEFIKFNVCIKKIAKKDFFKHTFKLMFYVTVAWNIYR